MSAEQMLSCGSHDLVTIDVTLLVTVSNFVQGWLTAQSSNGFTGHSRAFPGLALEGGEERLHL